MNRLNHGEPALFSFSSFLYTLDIVFLLFLFKTKRILCIHNNCVLSIVQESARWLVTKKRYEDADHVIQRIASVNGKHSPDTSKIMTEASSADAEKSTNYTVIDLFKSNDMTKNTLGMLFIW